MPEQGHAHLLKLVARLSDIENDLGVVSAKRTQTIPAALPIVIGGAPLAIVDDNDNSNDR